MELSSKAQWVADVISELGLTEAFISAQQESNTELVNEITIIALSEVGKKIEKIQTTLLTNGEARAELDLVVFEGLAS